MSSGITSGNLAPGGGGGGGGTPTLQAVTTAGNTTTNNIIVGSGSVTNNIQPGAIIFDQAGGSISVQAGSATAARAISFPDASGTIALTSNIPGTPTLQQVTTAGNTTTNTIIVGSGSITNNMAAGNQVYDQAGGSLTLAPTTLTAARAQTYPDKSGTFAMTSDIPAAGTLQTVTNAGNTTTNNISILGSGSVFNTLSPTGNVLNQSGGAVTLAPAAGLTASWSQTYPNKSGTFAMTSDIPATPTLQQVTTAGATTSVSIIISSTVDPFIKVLDSTTGVSFIAQVAPTPEFGIQGASSNYNLITATLPAASTTVFNNLPPTSGNIITSGYSWISPLQTVTANYSLTLTDHTILANSTAGNLTITLLSTAPAGTMYVIKNSGTNITNTVTVSGAGCTIDGSASVVLAAIGATGAGFVSLQTTGSGAYFII